LAGYMSCTIVGNVGRDATLRYTQSGVAVADFSVAVTRKIGRDENRKEITTWVKVTCWRGLAEIAGQYVKKGTPILVVGVVDVSAYTDKGGQPAATLELTADTFQLLGGRGQSSGSGEYQSGGGYGDEYSDFRPPQTTDDIPF